MLGAFPSAVLWHYLVVITGTRLVPKPYQVGVMMWDFAFGGIYDDAFSGTILTHLLASMQRVYGGFALAIVIGIPLGLLIGKVKIIRQMLDPDAVAAAADPGHRMAAAVDDFSSGSGRMPRFFWCFSARSIRSCSTPSFGVRSVDHKLFEAASMLGCNGSSLFRQVVLPAATPSIFNGLRLGHGFAWILIVVGEMTGVPDGLGAVIMDGRTLSRTDLVITGMIVIGLAGFFSDRVIVAINNRLLRWSPQHHA